MGTTWIIANTYESLCVCNIEPLFCNSFFFRSDDVEFRILENIWKLYFLKKFNNIWRYIFSKNWIEFKGTEKTKLFGKFN